MVFRSTRSLVSEVFQWPKTLCFVFIETKRMLLETNQCDQDLSKRTAVSHTSASSSLNGVHNGAQVPEACCQHVTPVSCRYLQQLSSVKSPTDSHRVTFDVTPTEQLSRAIHVVKRSPISHHYGNLKNGWLYQFLNEDFLMISRHHHHHHHQFSFYQECR